MVYRYASPLSTSAMICLERSHLFEVELRHAIHLISRGCRIACGIPETFLFLSSVSKNVERWPWGVSRIHEARWILRTSVNHATCDIDGEMITLLAPGYVRSHNLSQTTISDLTSACQSSIPLKVDVTRLPNGQRCLNALGIRLTTVIVQAADGSRNDQRREDSPGQTSFDQSVGPNDYLFA